MKIKNLLIFGIVLLLVLQVGFVLAQEEGELIDVGEGLVLEDISVSGIGVEAEAITPSTNKVEFTGIGLGEEESSYVKIGDVEFPNIKSGFMKFGKDGEIKEANFLTDDKENSYWVNENEFIVPANSRFIFDGKKGFILAEGTEVKNVGGSARISGEDFKLWQGEKQYDVSGSLNFDEEGRAYIEDCFSEYCGRIAFGGLEIEKDSKTYLFFDGKEHEGRYVSFGENTLKIGKDVIIHFKKENPYIKIEEGDKVSIFSGTDSKIFIENRDSEELIPKILLSGREQIEIENGGRLDSFWYGESKKKMLTYHSISRYKSESTSPLEIIHNDADERIFVDNFHRFTIVPKNIKTEYISKSDGADITFSSRVKYNYLTEENVEKVIGKKIIFKDLNEGEKQVVLGNIRDYWETLTPETKESIKKIRFLSSLEGGISGQAYITRGLMEFPPEFSLNTFKHESAHLMHHADKSNKDWRVYRRFVNDIWKTREKLSSLSPEDEKYDFWKNKYTQFWKEGYKEYFSESFDKEWIKVAGPYDRALQTPMQIVYTQSAEDGGEIIKNTWSKEYRLASAPKFGYIRPYGGLYFHEDIAEFVGKTNEPEFFKLLLSEENEWHKIYRGKLDLLYKYKYISEPVYSKILEVAGIS